MKTVIVSSTKDPAGTNIHNELVDKLVSKDTSQIYDGQPILSDGITSLVTISRDLVLVDDLDNFFRDCRYIFISRHRAESGIPSLTAHFTGNFGTNSLGGRPGEIGKFSPSLLKNYLQSLYSLREEIPKSYAITLEATHHGPTSLAFPVLFVELGSEAEQWADRMAASYIAKALIACLHKSTTYEKCAVAIGGTHYSQKFNEFILSTEYALGPIVPKYALEFLDSAMLQQIVHKGDQKITHALLDMKGLGRHKDRIVKLLSEVGLEIVRA